MATDLDATLLGLAQVACYAPSSLRELPPAWIHAAFVRRNDAYCLRDAWRSCVEFRRQDIRTDQPEGPFDLVLRRNLAFTYFDEFGQRRIASRLAEQMTATVVGRHESPPPEAPFVPYAAALGIFRRGAAGTRHGVEVTAQQISHCAAVILTTSDQYARVSAGFTRSTSIAQARSSGVPSQEGVAV